MKSAEAEADERLPVRLEMHGPSAKVVIAGQDVSEQIRSYTVHHEVGQHPRMVVELAPDVTRAGLIGGLTQVVVGEPPSPGDAAAAFLSAIDPAQLERAVLQRHDLMTGGPHEGTRATLAQLVEWAQGINGGERSDGVV
ncbi:hypothetical protein ACIQXD_29660 [Streptomyces uncialis]|uniref:hypothetical protein n=1 Tax=Streptomyces uncialis TaxID=1048205 RepID=UPI0038021B78